MQTLVITGVSSGIGLETAKLAIGRGAWVFGSVRTGDDAVRVGRELGQGFTPLVFDVRDEIAVHAEAERPGARPSTAASRRSWKQDATTAWSRRRSPNSSGRG